MADARNANLITLTADIVAAHVANNNIPISDVPVLIDKVHGSLAGLGGAPSEPEPARAPAVPVRASVKPDFIVCLEDGKKLKLLKRHLAAEHGMTQAEYRERWGLSHDYPMVAPNYAEQRRALAVKIGLGRKSGEKRPPRRTKAGRSS